MIDVEEAMAPDAPILHEDLFTTGVDPKPKHPPISRKSSHFNKGDVEAGFKEADVVIEGRYTTQPVHQAYIEPHACLASYGAGWPDHHPCLQPGPVHDPRLHGEAAGIDMANIRVNPAEIGGGFGGKTIIYLEPLAYMLSKKWRQAGQDPDEPRRGVPRLRPDLRRRGGGQDRREEGRHIVAAQSILKFQAGAFPGSPVRQGCMCGMAVYDFPERADRRLRRRQQPAEGRRVPRARRADRHVRAGKPASMIWRANWASIRSGCAKRTAPETATRRLTASAWTNIGYQQTLAAVRASRT